MCRPQEMCVEFHPERAPHLSPELLRGPRGRHRDRLRPARGMRRVRRLGTRRGRRQADLLRALRAAAPRSGGRRHRRLRRAAHRGLQGPGPGEPGLRRAGAVLAARAPGRRPRPVLHDRLHHLGERPADVPHHGDRQRHRPGAQRQPGEHRRAARRGHDAAQRRRERPRRHAGQHRLGPGLRAARRIRRRHRGRGVRDAAAAPAARRVLAGLRGRADPLRRARPARRPAARARPPGARLGRRQRDGGAGHRRRVDGARGRARRAAGDRRGRHPQLPLRRARAQGLRLRVRLPRPSGHRDLRALGARRPRRDRPPAGAGGAGGGGPGDPHAGVGHPRGDRLRAGLGHPVRPGPGEERLRRAHVHPAEPDHPPARHPAEAEPAPRRHPGQAPDRRRRLDRARQHPARAGPHAARVRRAGGARADRLAARALAVLLRHRLRHPRRTGGQRAGRRGRPAVDRRGHPGLHLAGRPDRRERAAPLAAVHGVLHRRLPDPAARGGEAREAPAGRPRPPAGAHAGGRHVGCGVRRPGPRVEGLGRSGGRRRSSDAPGARRDGLLTTVSSWGAAGALDRP